MLDGEECQKNRRMGRYVEMKESQNIVSSRGMITLCVCMYHGYHLFLKRGVEAVGGKIAISESSTPQSVEAGVTVL